MFDKMINTIDQTDDESALNTKRKYARRADDRCVTIINGQMHPVENWSEGGMLVTADERVFALDQEYVFTLKFKLRDEIMEIDHKAKVIRKAPNKVALEYTAPTKDVNTRFQKVVDDYVAQRFAESQTL